MKSFKFYLFTFIVFTFCYHSYSQNWPRVITDEKGLEATIYQPQIESFEKDIIQARSAIMVKMSKDADPIFGAIRVEARVMTDVDTRLISRTDVVVEVAKFPNHDSIQVKILEAQLSADIPKWRFDITTDQLIASLDSVKTSTNDKYKNVPPDIIYVDYPAVLITIEGDPVLKNLENTQYEYVINTPFFIVNDPKNKTNYLKGGLLWYKSDKILSGWEWTKTVPSDLENYVKENSKNQELNVDPDTIKIKPKIIVKTKPSELIETDGKPDFAPIDGTSLLYIKNTVSDVIMDINSQIYFVLISGRWFKAKSLEGPWSFENPDQLPSDFAHIPDSSQVGNVLSSVPGTKEARNAILSTDVPQTAKIERTDTIEVKYDGNPQFEPIEDTELEYAVNTDKSVIKYYNNYYCCYNAVWYEASDASGPWTVATSVPDEIYDIGPESPVYNVKYVYIYDYTPSVVYVGYYPGYTGCYVYNGTVIYGTGYYYNPWYGPYYYPHPVTYGFSAHYGPYTGWTFGFGMSFGAPHAWFAFGYHPYPYHAGYWGAGGYHAAYNRGYYHGSRQGFYYGYRAGQNSNYYNRATPYNQNRNVYSRNTNVNINTNDINRNNINTKERQQTSINPTIENRQNTNAETKNNVFADKQGNVYRNENNQWQTRDGNNWSNVENSKNRSSFEQNQQYLNRQFNDRETSSRNFQNFDRQRQSFGGFGGRRR